MLEKEMTLVIGCELRSVDDLKNLTATIVDNQQVQVDGNVRLQHGVQIILCRQFARDQQSRFGAHPRRAQGC